MPLKRSMYQHPGGAYKAAVIVKFYTKYLYDRREAAPSERDNSQTVSQFENWRIVEVKKLGETVVENSSREVHTNNGCYKLGSQTFCFHTHLRIKGGTQTLSNFAEAFKLWAPWRKTNGTQASKHGQTLGSGCAKNLGEICPKVAQFQTVNIRGWNSFGKPLKIPCQDKDSNFQCPYRKTFWEPIWQQHWNKLNSLWRHNSNVEKVNPRLFKHLKISVKIMP